MPGEVQKYVVHRPGGFESLRLEVHSSAPMGPGEARISVEAVGVNYADCVVRRGLYASAKQYVGWPITPGFEVAGRIVELTPGVGTDGLEVGQAVVAVARFGGYASEVVVPRAQVFARVHGWDTAQNAAFPTVHLTADYALHLASVARGEVVLVHSAAGGVGLALVQLSKAAGARVIGVVGLPQKRDAARRAGADLVLLSTDPELWSQVEAFAPHGCAAIFDANGVRTLADSFAHLAPMGRLVVYGFATMLPRDGARVRWHRLAWDWLRTPRFNPLELTTRNRSVMGFNLSFLFTETATLREAMVRLRGAVERGELQAPVVTRIPFSDAAGAQRALESGRTVGKLVLELPAPQRSGA